MAEGGMALAEETLPLVGGLLVGRLRGGSCVDGAEYEGGGSGCIEVAIFALTTFRLGAFFCLFNLEGWIEAEEADGDSIRFVRC